MTTRYPAEQLAALMRAPSTAVALHRLAVSGPDTATYIERGLSWIVADRLAVAAGFHPALVWPEWLEEPTSSQLARRRSRKAANQRRLRERMTAEQHAAEAAANAAYRQTARRALALQERRRRASRRAA